MYNYETLCAPLGRQFSLYPVSCLCLSLLLRLALAYNSRGALAGGWSELASVCIAAMQMRLIVSHAFYESRIRRKEKKKKIS